MNCNCISLTYVFQNCILDIICDGLVAHSINMNNAGIVNYGIGGGVIITPCCGETVKLSPDKLDQLGLTILDLQDFRNQCAIAASSGGTDYESGNYTLLCDSTDANISYLAYYTFVDGVKENHYITLPSGIDTIGDLPSTATKCKESKVIQNCFKAGTDLWTNLICLQELNVVGNIWVNTLTGLAQLTAPVGAIPCENVDKETNTYCYKAIVNGAGYAIGDSVEFKQIFDVNDPMNPSFMIWFNVTTLTPIFILDSINPLNNTGTFPNIADFTTCGDYLINSLNNNVPEIPYGITYENNISNNNPQPAIVKSITVTKQSGAEVYISFDSGTTWPIRIIQNGSRTFGQGNNSNLDTSTMMFKQIGNGVYDIIWEV